jgi:hypothetical protein
MEPTIEDSAPTVTEQDLAAFESRIGRSIPAPYRAFLLRHNGGRPEQPGEFSMRDLNGRDQVGTVQRFLGVNADEYFNLEDYLKTYADRVPESFFPIAYDPGDNLIVISTAGDKAGAIYFWDHEFEADEGQPPTERNLYPISDNLDGLLDQLGKGA